MSTRRFFNYGDESRHRFMLQKCKAKPEDFSGLLTIYVSSGWPAGLLYFCTMRTLRLAFAIFAIATLSLLPQSPAHAETTIQPDAFAIEPSISPLAAHVSEAAAQPSESSTPNEQSSNASPTCYELLQSDLKSDTRFDPASNRELQSALQKATTYYRVHVLSKVVDGKTKFLVVMTPGRQADDAEAADQSLTSLMGHFEQVGLTGYGSALGSIIRERVLRRWRRKSKDRTQPKKFRLAQRLARRIISRFYGSYSQLDDPGVLKMYSQAKNPIAGHGADGSEKTVVLDANYSPSGWEHLDSIGSTVTWGLTALFVGISGHVPQDLTLGAEWLITAASTYRFAMRYSLTAPNLKLTPWYQRVFPLGVSFIRGKSAAIANSIEASLANHKSMLAVVPQNHIDEVVSLLENVGYEQRN